MPNERPIHLDVGVPSGNAFGTPAGTSGQPDARSEQQLADQGQSLRDLLDPPGSTPHKVDKAPNTALPRPFDLFQSTSAAPLAPAASPAASQGLAQTLDQMARRLLVGDGRQGRRGVQIQLDDAHLPGVVVDVFEDSGRLVARFTCGHEGSRERLSASADWFAANLAQRLQRDTRVEVQTDDPEDPCLQQADADC